MKLHLNVKNLVGLKFGKLEVVGVSDKRGNKNQLKWECVCDCGKEHTVTGESLRSGKSKSCGCLLRDSRYVKNRNFDRKEKLLEGEYGRLKSRHKKKKYYGKILSLPEFKLISLSPCFYCGVDGSNTVKDERTVNGKHYKVTDFILKFNGIDRLDNKYGYTRHNSVPCCKHCNWMKNSFNVEEFKEHILKIYGYWICKG